MRLTEGQVKIIADYIDYCGIKEIDVKLELVDHIATQTEEELAKNVLTFEDALKMVMIKWFPMFRQERSFTIGLIYSFPKIVKKKIEKIARINHSIFIYFFVFWAFSSFIVKLNNFKSENLNFIVNFVALLSGIGFIIILMLINYKSKPTTYRFLVNQSGTVLFFMPFIYFFDKEMNSLKLLICGLLLLQFVFSFKNFKLHNECLIKYGLIWS